MTSIPGSRLFILLQIKIYNICRLSELSFSLPSPFSEEQNGDLIQSGNQAEDSDRHDSAYPSGPHNFFQVVIKTHSFIVSSGSFDVLDYGSGTKRVVIPKKKVITTRNLEDWTKFKGVDLGSMILLQQNNKDESRVGQKMSN